MALTMQGEWQQGTIKCEDQKALAPSQRAQHAGRAQRLLFKTVVMPLTNVCSLHLFVLSLKV